MELPANEFIRRFLLHLLPPKFSKKNKIALAKQLIEERRKEQAQEELEDGCPPFESSHEKWDELMNIVQSLDQPNCPKCGEGTMRYNGPALE